MALVNGQATMKPTIHTPSGRAWIATTGIIALVFTVLVIAISLQSRSEIRQQILDRDGHVFSAVARMLQATGAQSPSGDILEVVLQTSRLGGVLAVQLFDTHGDFILAIPMEAAESSISPDDLARLRQGQPVARFLPQANLFDRFPGSTHLTPTEKGAIQEVIIPLFDPISGQSSGSVQYLLDGSPTQVEFAALDRTLLFQAGTALAVSMVGLLLLASLAFVRLRRSQQALIAQSARLLKANRELSLAARTSAVGAVTSHLIHGIRNALTGINLFFWKNDLSKVDPSDWNELEAAACKIQALVEDVVEILRDQASPTSFELSLSEFEAIVREKVLPKSMAAGIHFDSSRLGEVQIPGHTANILLLILMNVIDNALSITPKGRRVWVQITLRANDILFEVGDEGPGIPEEIQPCLFSPGTSGRAGGSGLGLAISHRLAANIHASLQLSRSDESGTAFHLLCPLESPATRQLAAEPLAPQAASAR
jgi:nitrogen-specific signal transduction histidine kinase